MKVLYTIILAALISSNLLSQTPNWQWARSAGGSNDDHAGSTATDRSGNVYVTGGFTSPTIIFGNFVLTKKDSFASYGDMYLVKYDANGNVIWAKSAGGSGRDVGNSVKIDGAGNVYVFGNFRSDTFVLSGIKLTNVNNRGTEADIFLAKYDGDGNILWAKSAGGIDYDHGASITIDESGNVYATGAFRSDSLMFDTIIVVNPNNPDKSTRVYLVKYDPNGNVVWVKSAGGTSYDDGKSITTDISGNIYLTGTFMSPILIFDSIILKNSSNTRDIFLAKYNSTGKLLWAKSAGGNGEDYSSAVITDLSGNVYITGNFSSTTLAFDSITLLNVGLRMMYFIKYDRNGNVVWAKTADGEGRDFGDDIVTDPSGNLYLLGTFGGRAIKFGSTTLVNGGDNDLFIVKYDTDGIVLWAQSAGGIDWDYGSSIVIDVFENIFIAGGFFSPSLVFGNTTLINAGAPRPDLYLAKLSTTVGLSESQKQTGITIYPNPFTSHTFIRFSETQINTSIKIVDVLGQEIKSINYSGKEAIIEKEEMISGLYFVKVTDEKDNTVIKKVIIQ